jgi:hypothetical protein
MRMADSPAPEAILTQLILAALLTLVAEAVEVRALACTARHRMSDALHDDEPMEDVEPDEARRAHVGQRHAQKVLEPHRARQVEARARRVLVVAERGLLEHRLGQHEQVLQVDLELGKHEQVLLRVAYLREYVLEFVDELAGAHCGQGHFEREHANLGQAVFIVQIEQPGHEQLRLGLHVYVLIVSEAFVQLQVHVLNAELDLGDLDLIEYVHCVEVVVPKSLYHVPQVDQVNCFEIVRFNSIV